jgi:DNA-binding transcriptional LysR family regulator
MRRGSAKSKSLHQLETSRSGAPVFADDARRVIAFEAGRYGLMSARSIVKLDTNAGKPSLTPLL